MPATMSLHTPKSRETALFQRVEYTRTASIPDPMTDPRVVTLVEAAKSAVAALKATGSSYQMAEAQKLTAALDAMKGQTE